MMKGYVKMKTLYDRIREYRKKLGLTQKELALKLGYESQSIIAKIESGLVDLPQSRIIAIANALDVSPGELMGIVTSSHKLTDKEIELIQLFRTFPRDVQEHSLDYLRFIHEKNMKATAELNGRGKLLYVAEEVQVYGNGSQD